MPNLSAAEHLKVARRLHFQGQNDEAVREYQLVLELEPENADAASGLRALGVEPPDPKRRGAIESAGSSVKTNFFVNQAKESELPAWRTGPFKIIIALLAGLAAFGIYQFVLVIVNFDNIKAAENVDAHIQKVKTREDGDTFVKVKIANFNPAPVRDIVISYTLLDKDGALVKEGKIPIHNTIPAGDSRVFDDIDLGQLKEKPDKVDHQKLESLVYGPKPKMPQRLVDKFVEASQKKDAEAFNDYDELSQDLDSFAPVLIGLGRSYAAQAGKTPSNWGHAIEQYKKAIECEPDSANAHYYLAIAYFYTKDMANAKKEIDQAAQLAPEDPAIDDAQRYVFHTKEPKPGKDASGGDLDEKAAAAKAKSKGK